MLKGRRRRVRLLHIPIVSAVVDGAVGLPDSLAGAGIECRHILPVKTVEGEHEQAIDEDRRGASAAVVVAGEILPGPEHLPRGRAEAGGAGTAVVHPQPPIGHNRCGARVAVEGMAEGGLGNLKDGQVVEPLPAGCIEGDDGEPRAVFGGVGQPDDAIGHHRRRPGLALDRHLPDDVFRLTPGDRQRRRQSPAISRRPTKLIPVGRPRLQAAAAGSNASRRQPRSANPRHASPHACMPSSGDHFRRRCSAA